MNTFDPQAIGKMLVALLRSSNNIHWVAGYAFGRTSNDDPFVVLYPAGDHLKFQVCRVYAHDFRKLPAEIVEQMPATAPEHPGDKEKAQRQENYRSCALMCVVTYDGKETQMGPEKRFSDVVFVAQRQTKAQGEPLGTPGAKRTGPDPDKAYEQNGHPGPSHERAVISREQIAQIDKLGKRIYGEELWTYGRRVQSAKWASLHEVTDVEALNQVQAMRLLRALDRRARGLT